MYTKEFPTEAWEGHARLGLMSLIDARSKENNIIHSLDLRFATWRLGVFFLFWKKNNYSIVYRSRMSDTSRSYSVNQTSHPPEP